MLITGDSNATLLDLTEISEAELEPQEIQVHREVCSMPDTADEAYLKIPMQTKPNFPVLFDGEREDTSTEVNVVQEYVKGTYALTMKYNSDLMKESKAYRFSEKTQEGTIAAVDYPAWLFTNDIVVANVNAYDNKPYYTTDGTASTYHKWANAGPNAINNSVTGTGFTLTALYADFVTAVTRMRTFLDDKNRLMNPRLKMGDGKLVIRCPIFLEPAFMQMLNSTFYPAPASVTTSGTTSVGGVTAPAMIKQFMGMARVVSDGYLDAAGTVSGVNYQHSWFLDYVGMPQRPFVYSESYPLQSFALGFGSYLDQMQNQVAICTKQRFLLGTYRVDRSIRVVNT